jgi:hypothetical protein
LKVLVIDKLLEFSDHKSHEKNRIKCAVRGCTTRIYKCERGTVLHVSVNFHVLEDRVSFHFHDTCISLSKYVYNGNKNC